MADHHKLVLDGDAKTTRPSSGEPAQKKIKRDADINTATSAPIAEKMGNTIEVAEAPTQQDTSSEKVVPHRDAELFASFRLPTGIWDGIRNRYGYSPKKSDDDLLERIELPRPNTQFQQPDARVARIASNHGDFQILEGKLKKFHHDLADPIHDYISEGFKSEKISELADSFGTLLHIEDRYPRARPVLLAGAPGCGKSVIFDHVAASGLEGLTVSHSGRGTHSPVLFEAMPMDCEHEYIVVLEWMSVDAMSETVRGWISTLMGDIQDVKVDPPKKPESESDESDESDAESQVAKQTTVTIQSSFKARDVAAENLCAVYCKQQQILHSTKALEKFHAGFAIDDVSKLAGPRERQDALHTQLFDALFEAGNNLMDPTLLDQPRDQSQTREFVGQNIDEIQEIVKRYARPGKDIGDQVPCLWPFLLEIKINHRARYPAQVGQVICDVAGMPTRNTHLEFLANLQLRKAGRVMLVYPPHPDGRDGNSTLLPELYKHIIAENVREKDQKNRRDFRVMIVVSLADKLPKPEKDRLFAIYKPQPSLYKEMAGVMDGYNNLLQSKRYDELKSFEDAHQRDLDKIVFDNLNSQAVFKYYKERQWRHRKDRPVRVEWTKAELYGELVRGGVTASSAALEHTGIPALQRDVDRHFVNPKIKTLIDTYIELGELAKSAIAHISSNPGRNCKDAAWDHEELILHAAHRLLQSYPFVKAMLDNIVDYHFKHQVD